MRRATPERASAHPAPLRITRSRTACATTVPSAHKCSGTMVVVRSAGPGSRSTRCGMQAPRDRATFSCAGCRPPFHPLLNRFILLCSPGFERAGGGSVPPSTQTPCNALTFLCECRSAFFVPLRCPARFTACSSCNHVDVLYISVRVGLLLRVRARLFPDAAA